MKPKITTEHNKGQATIFKNPFLESLTKTNLTQNVIVYGIIVILFIYHAIFNIGIPVSKFLILFISALFFWTLAEYFLHRHLFHWMSNNPIMKRFHFIMHGSHHLYPRDAERILMPPVPGVILASLLFTIFYFFFNFIGIPNLTWAFFPGFFLGYILYSFLHLATHINKPPKKFKYLWKHHSIHHYKYPDKAFGVSTTIWDRVFGTMPPQKI